MADTEAAVGKRRGRWLIVLSVMRRVSWAHLILVLAGLAALAAGIFVVLQENTATALLIVGAVLLVVALIDWEEIAAGGEGLSFRIRRGAVNRGSKRLLDAAEAAEATEDPAEARRVLKAAAVETRAELLTVDPPWQAGSAKEGLLAYLMSEMRKPRAESTVQDGRVLLTLRVPFGDTFVSTCRVTAPDDRFTESIRVGRAGLWQAGQSPTDVSFSAEYPTDFPGADDLTPGTYQVAWGKWVRGTPGIYAPLAEPLEVQARAEFTIPPD